MMDLSIDEVGRFTENLSFNVRPETKEEIIKIAENLDVKMSHVLRRFVSFGLEISKEKNKKAGKK